MGIYSQYILPRLMDWSMSSPLLAQYRSEVLASVQGEILEIGFGTGLNLAYYPYQVERITTIDANSGMQAIAEPRIRDSSIQVEYRVLNGESLPMPDHTFDSVVSTWTLCSIAKVDRAIAEIHRVLKPGGKFFFIEHGLSSDPKVQIWQNRLTPLQKAIADGCHLNRNIAQLVENHFSDVAVEQFYAKGLPKVGGYMYKGVATRI
jgi:ubiquinone/menaquinone biosynthesis C-methylase UbiE